MVTVCAVLGLVQKELEREAAIYSKQNLQGTEVPIFYGLFEGLTTDDNFTVPVVCLFIEDCGNPSESLFSGLTLGHRAQILRILGHLHLLYVCPNDFSERNVVQNRDAFRLIGFRDVDEEHQCLWEGASLYEGEYEPKMSQIGCADLYEIGQELALWKSNEPGAPPLHPCFSFVPIHLSQKQGNRSLY